MLSTTPYEATYGEVCRGKLAPFDEFVYDLLKTEHHRLFQWGQNLSSGITQPGQMVIPQLSAASSSQLLPVVAIASTVRSQALLGFSLGLGFRV